MRLLLRLLPLGLLIAAANPEGGTTATASASLEQRVLDELNRFRTAPATLAEDLRVFRTWHDGDLLRIPGLKYAIATQEGVPAVDEALAFARAQNALPPLRYSPVLAQAAADHAAYLSEGRTGHFGPDGTDASDRVTRRGGGPYVAEIISFGYDDAPGVARQFVVDDGVPDRGHREIMFSGRYRYAGVACGPHPRYRSLCVVNLAASPDGR